jgi:hypothetical protein
VDYYLQTLPIQASTRVLLSYEGPLLSFYLFWKCCWFLFHKPFFFCIISTSSPTYIYNFSISSAHRTSSIEFQSVLTHSGMWPKKKKKKFDSYYLEIRTVKNSPNFTMALIQCEILHPTVKSWIFNLFFQFFWIFLKNQRFRGGNWQKWAWNFRG